MIDTPHLAWPVRLNAAGTTYLTVEQDTPEEHAQAAAVVLATPAGSLIDAPALGVPDAAFAPGGANSDTLRAALQRWEPRIAADVVAQAIADRRQRVDVTIGASRGR